MSYADKTPIRESLLSRVEPLIDQLKGNVVVLEYDVQLQSWPVGGGNPQLVSSWCLVILALGALVGEENYLSFIWTFGTTPQVPNDHALKDAVRQCFQRLGLMRMRQLQTPAGSDNN